jgi:4-amino-4-deoxy-L-arabinose transferase-like glycosyltransferase
LGVQQATNIKNDYAAAFWTVCLAYLVVLGKRRRLAALEIGLLGAATGLGMLTKGTFFPFPFAFAMLAWFFLPRLWTEGVVRTVGQDLLALAVVGVLNIGFWARNVATYGDPYAGFVGNVISGEEAVRSAEVEEAAGLGRLKDDALVDRLERGAYLRHWGSP